MNKFLSIHAEIKDYNAHIITGSVVVLTSLFLIFYAIPHQIAEGFGRHMMSPRSFPYFTAYVLLFCGIYVIFDGFRKKKELARYNESPQLVDFSLLAIIFTLLGFFFAGFIRTLGYPLCNILIMLVIYYIFGGRKFLVGLATAIAFTVVSWLFFVVYLNLSIPIGFGS